MCISKLINDHLKALSSVFILGGGDTNKILSSIEFLPIDVQNEIYQIYNMRMIRLVPNPYINTEELKMRSNSNFVKFNRCMKSNLGSSRIYSSLEIIGNVILSSFFQETYYDMMLIFESRFKFKPTIDYINILRCIFPDNKLFQIVLSN